MEVNSFSNVETINQSDVIPIKDRFELWKNRVSESSKDSFSKFRDSYQGHTSPVATNTKDLMVVEINFGDNKSEDILVKADDDPEKLAQVSSTYVICWKACIV